MKDWLLKDDKKNKVGRPKLADDNVVKKAKYMIVFSLFICFILSYLFICDIKEVDPLSQAYSLTLSKLFGSIKNKDGFIVEEGYDKDNDYIIKIKPSSLVDSYSGSYKYVLYKLNGSNWKEIESKEYPKKTDVFKIKVKSLKNQNQTYKISLYILNGAKINKSFAPFNWQFSDSSKQNEKHTYKIFTVKGYYSPVKLDEEKEINSKKEVISVTTAKKEPRFFKLSVPNFNYRVLVKYTDETGKEITLSDDINCTNNKSYKVPNVNKLSTITFKVWPNDISKDELEKIKLSSWSVKKDSQGKYYVQGIYTLKPENNYRN